ncbi:MAG: D-sedoheptulose 7-phosphate isomerase [Elusimicrobia bacterium]|nr:D-sedoheptulose 7-phosphate isomerase [Elusimicrobiota bacterium]
MKQTIAKHITDSIDTKKKMLDDGSVALIERIAQKMLDTYRSGGKILVFGNGGSAADAQHLAAELVVRFEKNRPALACMALTDNTSSLTAIGNDFGFEDLFSRQIEAFAKPGDLVLAISTSGNSPNVLKGIEAARSRGAFVVGFTGAAGGKLNTTADICFCAPSSVTARVQECHILAIHILSALLETILFEKKTR